MGVSHHVTFRDAVTQNDRIDRAQLGAAPDGVTLERAAAEEYRYTPGFIAVFSPDPNDMRLGSSARAAARFFTHRVLGR